MNVLGCEGNEEVYLIEYLIEQGYLIFDKKDILDRRPIHFRQPSEISALIDILPIDTELKFYRIGDTQTDEYDFRRFKLREGHYEEIEVCTTPEIEMLVIINEGLFNKYQKMKSKMMPKEFVKVYVKGYMNLKDYLKNHDIKDAIIEYKRLSKKKKGQVFLADLIK